MTIMDELRWKKFPVLDDGFVCLVDVMGDDSSIVQAARVSYGEGTKHVSDDRNLIRYLMRHRHTTPFEMAEIKVLVRVPMDAWRQWIRHRTACLAGDNIISFDLPNGRSDSNRPYRHYPITVKELFERFQPTKNETRPDKQKNPYYKRDRAKRMLLRSYNEDQNTIYHTHITDIWESGIKQIIRVEFDNNKILRASEDHLCLTDNGWLKLKDAIAQRAMFLSSAKKSRNNDQIIHYTDAEHWAQIPEYENYEVSTHGRIRSYVSAGGQNNLKMVSKPKCKQLTIDDRGYFIVGLSKNSQTRAFSVHKLVLESFIGPCPPNMETRHLDSNRLNNHISNLDYGTLQENTNDRMNGGYNQHLSPTYITPKSWSYDGEEMTYDISVEGPYHNFFAGGMVVHNSVNEYSTRYSVAIDAAQQTAPDEWRLQSTRNNQGSDGTLDISKGAELTESEREIQEKAREIYQKRIDMGVAREQARKDLPLSTYTEAYWKIDLHNLFHFLGLRMDHHAQLEIRKYATVVGEEIVSKLFPLAWEAFEDYRLNGMYLTRLDVETIHDMVDMLIVDACGDSSQKTDKSSFMGHVCLPEEWKEKKRCRERDELFEKLKRLGFTK